MAVRKKRAAPRKPAKKTSKALAVSKPTYAPAAPATNDPTAFYVKLPLSPEVVLALHEHAANGSRLLELVTGTDAAARDIFDAISKAATALERDVARVRAVLAKRRR